MHILKIEDGIWLEMWPIAPILVVFNCSQDYARYGGLEFGWLCGIRDQFYHRDHRTIVARFPCAPKLVITEGWLNPPDPEAMEGVEEKKISRRGMTLCRNP